MYYFSTNYHLFVVESEESEIFPLDLQDIFVFTEKVDAQDLALLLHPQEYVIAGVMDMEVSSKLVWVVQHNLGEGLDTEKLLDFIHDSLNHFKDEFQDEWV
jgi:hypothetical protein|tara:strand:- start:2563 stop:2865 length:303 start_codon:yes stop_codon:yes gene_type:complete